MSILMMGLILIGAIALIAFGVSALKLQGLLLDVPKEQLKEAGINLEKPVLNLAPHYLNRARKLKKPEIERTARMMQIEAYVFVAIFAVLLLYAIVISV